MNTEPTIYHYDNRTYVSHDDYAALHLKYTALCRDVSATCSSLSAGLDKLREPVKECPHIVQQTLPGFHIVCGVPFGDATHPKATTTYNAEMDAWVERNERKPRCAMRGGFAHRMREGECIDCGWGA